MIVVNGGISIGRVASGDIAALHRLVVGVGDDLEIAISAVVRKTVVWWKAPQSEETTRLSAKDTGKRSSTEVRSIHQMKFQLELPRMKDMIEDPKLAERMKNV